MPKRLWIGSIDSVGAVDAGDDPEARMLFFKRRGKESPLGGVSETEGDKMAEFDVAALSDDQAAALEEYVQSRIDKALEETPEPVDVEKGLPDEAQALIEDLRKRADEADERLAGEIEKREQTEWLGKAEPFAGLIGDPVETAPVLRALAKDHPEETATVLGWFQSIADKVDLAELFKTKGQADPESPDRDTFIAAKVREGMGPVEAAALFWKEHPEARVAEREGS